MKRLWIFADWKLPNDADLELIEDLGFTDVVLGVGVIKSGRFKPKYSDSRIVESAEKIHALGARVHVMSWIKRQRTFIKDLAKWLPEICEATGSATGLLDAELEWHRNFGISAEDAAELMSQELGEMPCPVGVTGLSNLHKTVRPLLGVCDYGLGQAYSIWKPDKKHWSHSRATEPGAQQATSWTSWGAAGKPLVMGLSNYWARRPARFGLPAMSARESLETAIEAARRVGATEVAYWSLKWLHGAGAARVTAREVTQNIDITPADIADESPTNPAAAVQWLLVQRGYDIGSYGPKGDGVDGLWGARSQRALDMFRKAQGAAADGIFVLEDVTLLVNTLRASQ